MASLHNRSCISLSALHASRLDNLHAVCLLHQPKIRHDGPRLARTVARSRLPHMDEELEHMAWQLDRRSQEGTAGPNGHAGSRHKTPRHRLVFHDRDSKQGHQGRHRQHRQHPHSRTHGSSSESGGGGSSSGDDAAGSVAAAGPCSSSAGLDSQMQAASELPGRLEDEQQYYCVRLGLHASAAQDLQKAQERMARRMQQDGGCCVSATLGQASLLTHLLLLLQHKQLHRQHPGTLLLLQPLSCDSTPASASGSNNSSSQQAPSGRSRATVLQPGASSQHLSCPCPVEELKLFTSFMPLQALVSLEATAAGEALLAAPGSSAAADVVSVGTLESIDAAGASLASSSSPSLHSWSAAESSAEDAVQTPTHSSRASRASSELLKAASSSSSSTAALLADVAARGRLRCARVGPHADTGATAASILASITAGEVLALHIKGQAVAHAAAYMALQLASSELHSVAQQKHLGFGVLLVQGHGHEHVHATSHGHSSAASMDSQLAPGVAAAAAAGEASQHQPHARVLTDASMDVGGFGAAFYGLGSFVGASQQASQQAVLHQHGQEVWLCVVPLKMAA